MAYKIKINKRFKINSQKVYQYLVQEWSFKVADEFLDDLYLKIDHLAEKPFTGSLTLKYKNVRKLVISKHNKIYYRVKGKTVTVLTLFPSKMNPERNKYE